MKIAIFSPEIDRASGFGNIAYELCFEFFREGLDFVLFLPRKRKNDSISHEDYPFPVEYVLPDYISGLKNKNFIKYFKILDLKGFDLVHCLFELPYCFMAARCAKKNKIPFIMGAQGTYGVLPLTKWPNKYFLKWCYSQARKIIVPSQFTKEKIQQFSKTKTEIEIIHNGVNFKRFQEKREITDLRNKFKGKKTLLTVGGLKPRKGQDIVIKALAKVKPVYNNFHYFVAGGGNWITYLNQLSKDSGLIEHVSLLGPVLGEDLVKYFQFCDIYIHLARNVNWNFEGFGIVYLEASACGKPIIAADSGGIRDAVIENKTGLIVPENDFDGATQAILKLFQNPNLAEELGKNGLEYAKEHNWSIIAQKFLETYKKIL